MAKLIYFVFVLLLSNAFAVFTNFQTASYTSLPKQCVPEINPHPFIKIGLKYYIVETAVQVNWFEAMHRCRALGGDLATIESDAEMTALSDYLLAHGQRANWIWVDGTDLGEKGIYKHLSTGRRLSYSRWSPGQPDNARGEEDCINICVGGNKFEMNDYKCTNTLNYICEMKTPQVLSVISW